ncbi:MAG: dTMP kinase [Firmicutes bacterium]|nr:dTMP kinase [Bacillota bacterium]
MKRQGCSFKLGCRGGKAVFITFEGIDGSGKTTQLKLLAAWLREQGCDPVTVREPGGTALGENIRSLLLSLQEGPTTATAELLLYAAARAELVSTVIRPALEAGRIVLADRFSDSTWAYQVCGRGLEPKWAKQVLAGAAPGLKPALTLLFDLEPAMALARSGRGDRLERESIDFFTRVREGYLTLAAKEAQRIRVIAVNNKDIRAVQTLIRREVADLLFD